MLAKPLLFLSSYSPLFALLALRFQPIWLIITCIVLALVGMISLGLLFRLDARASRGMHTLEDAKPAGAEAGAYVGTYLLPFVTVSTPSIRDAAAYAVFIVIAATIHLRSSIIQINPLLYLIGYKVISIVDTNELGAYVVTRQSLRKGDTIEATRFGNNVLINRPNRTASHNNNLNN